MRAYGEDRRVKRSKVSKVRLEYTYFFVKFFYQRLSEGLNLGMNYVLDLPIRLVRM